MRQPEGSDQLLACFSDIEMGAGGLLDDFPHSDWLGGVFDRYADLPVQVDLVFNGDTFDFLKTSVEGTWPRHVTAEVALHKLERVLAAHPHFVQGLQRFLARPDRHVHFTVGNHDAELVFPEVQQALRERVGADLHFPGFSLDLGDAHFEHGAQADDMFRMDPASLFVDFQGDRILRLPWGSVCLLDVVLPLQHLMFDLDRVKPRRRVFELVPEVRDVVVQAYWRYWTGEYARDAYAGHDPLRTASWTMLREVAYRMRTGDPELMPSPQFLDLLQGDDGYRVVCVGHLHEPALVTRADRRLITTGCVRNEYLMDAGGRIVGALPKSWAHVWQREGHTRVTELHEEYGPPPPRGHAPGHVLDVLARIAPLMANKAELAALKRAQQAQLDRER